MRICCVALLLSLQALLVGWIGLVAAPNKTEVGHMAATAYSWRTLRFDVFNVNPPLTRMVNGLPVVVCNLECDWDRYSSRPQDRSEWAIGHALIAVNNPEKTWWCFALARWSLIPLLLLGGYFGYRLSGEMYGDPAALMFLTLWCFSPFLLAWGATICPDAVAAALGLVAVYSFRQWLHKPNWMQAVIAGVSLGLLPLTKLTWILAFGIWPLIWCLWTAPNRLMRDGEPRAPWPPLRQLVAILFLGLYTLNMGYLFDGTGRRLGRYLFMSRSLNAQYGAEDRHLPVTGNRFAGTWLGAVPIPLPSEFVQGIDTQRYDFERGLPSYLRGEWADHGWWCYYLYVAVVKMPLGTWCLVVLAVFCALFQKGYNAAWRDEMVVLLPCVFLFFFVSAQTGFSAHSRYIAPALPLLFVGISRVGRAFTLKWPIVAALAAFSLAHMITSSMSIYPHSLSYFNELAALLPTPADTSYPKLLHESDESRGVMSRIGYMLTPGPRNGPRHLLDSNIDWGQDLFYLKDWLYEHPGLKFDGLAYWGSYPATLAGIPETRSPPTGPAEKGTDPGIDPIGPNGPKSPSDKADQSTVPASADQLGPKAGWYALSVNYIYSRNREYRYFLYFEPVAMAGYSIYIYHITIDEANRVRRGLGLPALPGNEEQKRKPMSRE